MLSELVIDSAEWTCSECGALEFATFRKSEFYHTSQIADVQVTVGAVKRRVGVPVPMGWLQGDAAADTDDDPIRLLCPNCQGGLYQLGLRGAKAVVEAAFAYPDNKILAITAVRALLMRTHSSTSASAPRGPTTLDVVNPPKRST